MREGDWHPGRGDTAPTLAPSLVTGRDPQIVAALRRAEQGKDLGASEIARLFTAEGRDFDAVRAFADELRRERVGDTVTHVVNRNINYTNICLYHCGFCAFSKGSTRSERGRAYNIDHGEIAQRTIECSINTKPITSLLL